MIDPRTEADTPFTDTEIREIENALQHPLPQDYQDFVKKYGGAFVGGEVDVGERFHILAFFEAQEVFGRLRYYDDLREDGILPFADCAFGNLHVIIKSGEVYYIDYCGGSTSVHKLADSFGEFLSRIVVEDD